MPRFCLRFAALLLFSATAVPAVAQSVYEADGTPTAMEEEIRWQVNRARFNRHRENQRRGTSYTDIPVRSAPLAPHAAITRAARHHSEDMARRDVFQHRTVSGSYHYNASVHKQPWDRMEAEGYVWNLAGENIAAGYYTGHSAYVGWWKSEGHRVNMGDAGFCEIGNGHYFHNSSEYGDYYTMDLGRSGDRRFFTGTVFHDANGNKAYTQGEGRAGVRVLLLINGTPHSFCDVSTPVGSFAVPIEAISNGTLVRVVLENTSTEPLQLNIPLDAENLEPVTLAAGQSRFWGSFIKGGGNVGFRDLEVAASFVTLAPGFRTHAAEGTANALLEVESSAAWTAQSSAPWLRLTGAPSGAGSGSLSYAVDPHDFGDARVATITVTGVEGAVGNFTVTQTGVPPVLLAALDSAVQPAAGVAELTVPVTANVTWQAATSAHWVQLDTAAGTGSGDLVFAVAPNNSSLPRQTEITVQGGELSVTLTVAQAAGASPSVAEVVAFDPAEGAGQVRKISGLPPGLRWDKTSALVIGQPSRAGTYHVKVQVLTADSLQWQQFTLVVQALPESAVGVFEVRIAQQAGVMDGCGAELRFTTTRSGVVSGVLRANGRRRNLGGRLVFEPGAGVVWRPAVSQAASAPALELEILLAEDNHCGGLARSGGATAAVAGWRRIWKTSTAPVPSSLTGAYNVLGQLGTAWYGDETLPQGLACAVLKVSASGRANWSGKLGDGVTFTRSGWLGPQGESGCWTSLYRSTGAVLWLGELDGGSGAFDGEALWIKSDSQPSSTRAYVHGFGWDERGPMRLMLIGERWTAPAPGQTLASMLGLMGETDEWHITFMHGVIADTTAGNPSRQLGLDVSNRFILPAPGAAGNESKLGLRLRPATGRVTGSFELLDDHPARPGSKLRRKVSFEGLLLPQRRLMGGFHRAAKRPSAATASPRGPTAPTDIVSGLVLLQTVSG